MTHQKKRIVLISTGGTIEKTYDPLSGLLANDVSVLDVMFTKLAILGVEVTRVPLMNKDSLGMSKGDHALIAKTALNLGEAYDGVIVVHGTDTLAVTGERIYDEAGGKPSVPIVLTGAMRPYALRTTDSIQNLTEALLAVQLVAPGVYVAMHNKVLAFPGAVKDVDAGTFVWHPPRDED